MLPRVLFALLLLPALLPAEGPGVIVEGSMTQFAQDGDGRVWAIKDGARNGINMLVDSHWDSQRVPELDSDCSPVALEKFEDGDVGCLWRDPHEGEDAWVLTRHRAGHSRIAKRFRAKLKQPAMLGVRDGNVFITESGPTFLALFVDDEKSKSITIPESLFIPPEKKQSDGSISDEHSPVRAQVGLSGDIWLWSPEIQRHPWSWRLAGLERMRDISNDNTNVHQILLGDGTPPVSVFVPWGEKQLAVAIQGSGLHFLDQASVKVAPATVPDADAFRYVEQIFHDGTAWYAVTTPRPTEMETFAAEALQGRLGIRTTTFYDSTKPTCALWRHEAGVWKLVKDGLDKEPSTRRPWLRTKAGLFLGTDTGPPWFFPGGGGDPRRISRAETFPLPRVDFMFQVNDGQVLFASRYSASGCLWPSDASILEEKPLRWEKFVTTQRALQDSRGHIWCLRGSQSFVRWDGREWSSFPPPPSKAINACIDFAPDDQDRGWLLHFDDAPTAVCDFATGKWVSFPDAREAFAAQLPKGAKLSLPGYSFYEPAFSGDGRIGAFMDRDKVRLYEQSRWREWKFRDVAGPDAKLGGTPFFAPDGRFSVPVGEGTAWEWHGDSTGWQRADGITVPHPGTGPDRKQVELPEGTASHGVRSESVTRDRHGVFWFLRNGTELCKAMPGREVKVFDASESNPFALGGGLYRALVDDSGNALIDTSDFSTDHQQLFIRARLPVPVCAARLALNEEDTAKLAVGEGSATPLWHAYRVDGGQWESLRDAREIKLEGLLPGRHAVEVRAFNADLTPSSKTVTVTFVTTPAAEAQFTARLRDLSSLDLDTREAAARMLQSQGAAALPKLRAARASAARDVQWWLDAIIQHIERQSTPVPNQ
jgi:hypothetical protein